MSRKAKIEARIASGFIEVKSKFDAEYRRFSLSVNPQRLPTFEEFSQHVGRIHNLRNLPYTITYTDPEGDLLPINNNENFAKALSTARPLLRLIIQRKGQNEYELNGYGTAQRKRNVISMLMPGDSKPKHHIPISLPEDFRQVSAIIDVDILPETQRRVKLMKNGSEKPLGFFIRDGTSVRVTSDGLEKVPGIFISRLVQGGLAQSTGLLAVNDEVLEVNGIEVVGKTLDQVTDMMIANSANLIITIRPVNQHADTLERERVASLDNVRASLAPENSSMSLPASEVMPEDDEDEVKEFVVSADGDAAKNQDTSDETNDRIDFSSEVTTTSSNSSRML